MRYILFVIMVFSIHPLLAQKRYDNNINTVYLHFNVGYHVPMGDMKDRFGNNFSLSNHTELITKDRHYIFGIHGAYHFSDLVKEDVLAPLRSPEGAIYGSDRTFATVAQTEVGLSFGVHVGKLFPIGDNPRAGIRTTLGVGMFRHRINIQDEFDAVLQIGGDYIKLYDRLTQGLAITPFVGYQYTSKNRLLNVMVGIEYLAGFTKGQRSWDVNMQAPYDDRRFDGLFGLKAGFALPLFVGDSQTDVHY